MTPPKGHKNKAKELGFVTWIGGVLAGLAAIGTLAFAIYQFATSRREDLRLESYYYRMSGATAAHLTDVVTGLHELGDPPGLADNDCLHSFVR